MHFPRFEAALGWCDASGAVKVLAGSAEVPDEAFLEGTEHRPEEAHYDQALLRARGRGAHKLEGEDAHPAPGSTLWYSSRRSWGAVSVLPGAVRGPN